MRQWIEQVLNAAAVSEHSKGGSGTPIAYVDSYELRRIIHDELQPIRELLEKRLAS